MDEPHPPSQPTPSVTTLGLSGLERLFAQRGWPPYRARQVWRWVWRARATSFDQMSDLPRSVRQELDASMTVLETQVHQEQAADDLTVKLLLALHDQQHVECVLLQDPGPGPTHATACLSTQVGCAMGCTFCASGVGGLVRNLSATEIVEQALWLQTRLAPERRLTHIVVMGMGEPLANLDALLPALDRLGAPDGLGISARRVTLSTVGLPGRMARLAQSGRAYHLAVSLHAPDDALRRCLIPASAGIGVQRLVRDALAYQQATGRQVTFEYVLLDGVNDRHEHAVRLGRLLRGTQTHVNVIPYNHVAGNDLRGSSPDAARRFASALRQAGLSVKVRKRRGRGIEAACGQLRLRHSDGAQENGTVGPRG